MTMSPLMFVSFPTMSGEEVTIEVSKIVSIKQDPAQTHRATVSTLDGHYHQITFPRGEMEDVNARREILAILEDVAMRAAGVNILDDLLKAGMVECDEEEGPPEAYSCACGDDAAHPRSRLCGA